MTGTHLRERLTHKTYTSNLARWKLDEFALRALRRGASSKRSPIVTGGSSFVSCARDSSKEAFSIRQSVQVSLLCRSISLAYARVNASSPGGRRRRSNIRWLSKRSIKSSRCPPARSSTVVQLKGIGLSSTCYSISSISSMAVAPRHRHSKRRLAS